jgi:Prokaryotic membrane lipoprotein lipid attachment site
MKRIITYFVLVAILAACGGIPLRSMPRLMGLQQELLNANPAEFMVAVQVDERMAPPPSAAPVMQLAIRSREPGAFDSIERKLPMRFDMNSAQTLGLQTAAANRRWLIYSFPPESQAELSRIQTFFKDLQARSEGKGGGSLAVGISQTGVAARDPALAKTKWESWLQTSRKEGFFELWSGTVEELLKQAK